MRLVSTKYRPLGLIYGLGLALGCSGGLWDGFQRKQKKSQSPFEVNRPITAQPRSQRRRPAPSALPAPRSSSRALAHASSFHSPSAQLSQESASRASSAQPPAVTAAAL